jgi:acetyl-CoA carboxylase biotin carboxyl carrier protein
LTCLDKERTRVSLTYKEVAEIIRIIDASNLDELVIEIGDARIHVRRNGSGGQATSLPTAGASASHELPLAAAAPAIKASGGTRARADQVAGQLAGKAVVRSPMLGVFYRAPSPNAPSFVEVGTKVKRGDPLCLIEVMKLFTTITADQDGRVAHVLPANGDLVEFDQPLFVLEPEP